MFLILILSTSTIQAARGAYKAPWRVFARGPTAARAYFDYKMLMDNMINSVVRHLNVYVGKGRLLCTKVARLVVTQV